jgi:uncharacterized protein YyaL (SSP411 family)
MTEGRRENRLAKEKSPYLQQHKLNPVDWYPWGEEAFEKARREEKPIFLSIGYSTCHWCHVMERESFENEEIAAVLNAKYVSIKVDREERPDVDAVYMAAVTAMTQHGGWPLSAFLTADREPFFGGTYYPPAPFKEILEKIADLWAKDRARILKGGADFAKSLALQSGPGAPGALDEGVFAKGLAQFAQQYDEKRGGFGRAPKFPRSVALEFLLRMHRRLDSAEALAMVRRQLDAMKDGGVYDHLGGGFHRYSTDAEWLVPHFEKMLYDNALLVRAYVQAWQLTKDPEYERVVRETCDYVIRDMTAPEGGFYSAEDADSEDFEGTFYLWTPAKVKAVVPGKDGDLLCQALGVVEGGNWVPHEAREPRGNSVVHRADMPDGLTKEALADGKRRLFEARSKRPRPHRDDKILTEWNALMIGALALAGAVFEEPRYLASAEKATRFVLDKLRRPDRRLLRRYRDGESAIPAFLDDHAFLADGLFELHQATFRPEYLEESLATAEAMIDLFGDPEGGFYLTANDHEGLIVRTREVYDGAMPSGASVAIQAILKLAEMTSSDRLREVAKKALARHATELSGFPQAYPNLASAADMALSPWREIVIAGESPAFLREIRRRYLPNTVLAMADERLVKRVPMLEGKKPVGGKPAAYVCENYSCKAPVTSVDDLTRLLDAAKPK